MRNGFLGSLMTLAAGAGLALGQQAIPDPAALPMAGPGGPAIGGVVPAPIPLYGGPDPYAMGGYGPQMPPQGPPEPRVECVWLNGEYLLWRMRSAQPSFPLVTTSAPSSLGILAQPSTAVIFGGEKFDFDTFNGFRVMAGTWFDQSKRIGIEGGGFMLEQRTIPFRATSGIDGSPTIARPIIEANTLTPSAQTVSFPGVAFGSVDVLTDTRTFGAEGNLVCNIWRSGPGDWYRFKLDALAGFRYVSFEESLRINTSSTIQPGTQFTFDSALIDGPADVLVNDEFYTRNQFYGGQLGLRTEFQYWRWKFGLSGKVALGNMNQRLRINGSSTLTGLTLFQDQLVEDINSREVFRGFIFGPAPDLVAIPPFGVVVSVGQVPQLVVVREDVVTQRRQIVPVGRDFTNRTQVLGGLLATSSNIGNYQRDTVTILPEVGGTVGFELAPCCTLTVGYNFMYLQRVIRAANEVDPFVNASLVPTDATFGINNGAQRPAPRFNRTDVWLTGISFGVNFSY